MESAGDAVFVSDLSGQFTFVNATAHALLGYTNGELLRCSIPDVLSPEELAAFPAHAALLEVNPYVRRDWQLKRKDGSALSLELTTQRLPGDRYLAIGRDQSERNLALQQLESERIHLRTLVQTLPDLVWLKDNDGVYLGCNSAFERFFGAKEV